MAGNADAPGGPVFDADAAARAEVAGLIEGMRHAVLGCLDPATGAPHLSRVALQADRDKVPLALLSGLAAHTRALMADPRAGLLIAPGAGKGNPMAQPRLSLQVRAEPAEADPARRDRWLAAWPKAKLYVDLPDFRFWRLVPVSGLYNAGFGRAVRFGPDDLPPHR
ncbi:pyridoxamine 5-phosphate oxidase [Paracoccus sp. S-4012]|uniref:HugZ family pyridoxamine 5'-phosphate oxidase n=1 Tax=Paracoccus sp. S-4012 TaxID=2665648 RepID=UPI0012B0CC17|nr:pyridoxamine 5'-phosphate oxidase family protein [Paracoccus sp. S-4012]MRX51257.1 pyridoxamine 5-phosphate oxidase [Paracoccus sp. S-4012]